ncbi:phosphate regulon sensor histidine kinase PhoR [Salinibius halmophilus]|uniref:phosphate regulon sensor histidine kinase PhoR n=1 Tax=Salinibius halmophilus TaxID=1853216 RepID=UPI000E6764E4|nr:phosphate regulon sensor histidine kinase PhoR [Salinibius halmophilus]
MQNYPLWYYYRLLIGSIIVLAVVGALLGHVWLVLSLGLTFFVAWSIKQQHSLLKWLRNPTGAPPSADGLWGQLFDELYNRQRAHSAEIFRLRALLQRVRASAEAIPDGVIMVQNDGSIEWWNASAEKMLGLKPDDRGSALTNLIRDPKFVRYFKRGGGDSIKLSAPGREHVRLQMTLVTYNQTERLLMVRDITRLLQLEQMRQDFVANASHELRTPLTVLRGYLETILDQQERVPSFLHRPLKQMFGQSKRMGNLVEDLLLLTRLDADETDMLSSEVFVDNLMDQLVSDAQALSGEKQHRITFINEAKINLLGNPNELRSAFSNLVFNAVHYTPANGEITIRWQQEGGRLIFSVSDNGIGIDPAHIPRLTERFYRVDISRSSATGGTGLGLAIVKHVLQHHDAHLDVHSKPGQGSTFACVFPLARAATPSNP